MRGIPHWARYSAATLSGRMTMAFPGRLAGPRMLDCSCRTVNDGVILAVNSGISTTPNSHINAMVMRFSHPGASRSPCSPVAKIRVTPQFPSRTPRE